MWRWNLISKGKPDEESMERVCVDNYWHVDESCTEEIAHSQGMVVRDITLQIILDNRMFYFKN